MLSTATPRRAYSPSTRFDQVIVYGAVVTPPIADPFAKKSTRAIVPSLSEAIARMVTLVPSRNAELSAGAIRATDGIGSTRLYVQVPPGRVGSKSFGGFSRSRMP